MQLLNRALLCGVLALLAGAATAAEVSGQITHAGGRDKTRNVEIRIVGLIDGEKTVDRVTRTDAEGSFVFKDLPTPGGYILYASYGVLRFPGGHFIFKEDDPQPKRQLSFEVHDATEDNTLLRMRDLQWVIERDAGVFRVFERLVIENSGNEVVIRDPNSSDPAVLIGIAKDHGEVTLGPMQGEIRDSRAELWGPFHPGTTEIELVYDLDGFDPALRLEIPIEEWTDAFTLFVKDFGVYVDGGQLHPTRPAREGKVFYHRFAGFDLPAGTRREIEIIPLPPRPERARWIEGAIAAMLACGLFFFLRGPIAVPTDVNAAAVSDEEPELDALHASLRDLEHDFETGKLSEADRDRIRSELQREAEKAGAPVESI